MSGPPPPPPLGGKSAPPTGGAKKWTVDVPKADDSPQWLREWEENFQKGWIPNLEKQIKNVPDKVDIKNELSEAWGIIMAEDYSKDRVVKMVEWFLSQKPDVSIINKKYKNSVFKKLIKVPGANMTVKLGYVKQMIACPGFDVSFKDKEGETMFHIACQEHEYSGNYDMTQIITLLLSLPGADCTVKAKCDGRTPKERCIRLNHATLITLFDQYENKSKGAATGVPKPGGAAPAIGSSSTASATHPAGLEGKVALLESKLECMTSLIDVLMQECIKNPSCRNTSNLNELWYKLKNIN